MVPMIQKRVELRAEWSFEPRPLPEPVWELMIRGPARNNHTQQPPLQPFLLVLEGKANQICARENEERKLILNAPRYAGTIFNVNPAIVDLALDFERFLRKLCSPVIKLRDG